MIEHIPLDLGKLGRNTLEPKPLEYNHFHQVETRNRSFMLALTAHPESLDAQVDSLPAVKYRLNTLLESVCRSR